MKVVHLSRQSNLRSCAFVKVLAAMFLVSGMHVGLATVVFATQVDIPNPGDGHHFGGLVHALPNGNFVATADEGSVYSTVYLFDSEGQVISALEGARLGSGGITILTDGNFVVCSPEWSGQSASGDVLYQAGAVTWVDGVVGLTGEISADNSLIGSQSNDRICISGIVPVLGGKYVVGSWLWKRGELENVGAVTLCEERGACIGAVTQENSLTGSARSDSVGRAVIPLANGNYVVASPNWNRDGMTYVGAVTLCVASNGCAGRVVSTTNSLVGDSEGDSVGYAHTGYLDSRYPGVIPLESGDFVVVSSRWKNGDVDSAGAATWVNGWTGLTGTIGPENSLVGSTSFDFHRLHVTALVGGGYVVDNSAWDSGAVVDAGASTLCRGNGSCAGPISADNSLIGVRDYDRVGWSSTPLTNGNYVVHSPYASTGGRDRNGAVTWCDSQAGCRGYLLEENSLIGGSNLDLAGGVEGIALKGGAYVVNTGYWSRDGIANAGISFRCDDPRGCTGTLSASNSLVGSTANDEVGGDYPPILLASGNYVVQSNDWHGSGATGALTWIDGRKGLVGEVSEANSFVGTYTDSGIGNQPIFALPNGDYISTSPLWRNGRLENAGAITLLRGYGPQLGMISPSNSVIGNVPFAGRQLTYTYNAVTDTLIVGKYYENVVTLLRVDQLFFNGVD